jgi:phosphoglucosamine mutase
MNINRGCGSMHPEIICARVRETGAHLGIAHDGDADRVLLCDEQGNLIDGDDLLVIVALEMLRDGRLAKKTLVNTVMSNVGVDAALKAAGGRTVQTSVGDKYVIDEMLRNGYNLGGEQSGHIIFSDYGTTGDGLVAALQILRIMKANSQPLSSLSRCWTRFPQLITNLRVREKVPFEKLEEVLELVSRAEATLKPEGGRVLLRYSGTEPKARLLLEGRDAAMLQSWSTQIIEAIRRQVGA